ncbi:MAG: thioredoxin-dependent thiol peroxidase [Bacteroidales bacterium]|nr:thioredoxin-dependent thiol peroxidase [Bacteroidales bacterium]
MIILKVGDKAPEFKGVNQDGKEISLKDFAGKGLILFFYPKDNTPGCTAEACNLNESYLALRKKGFEILGVSADSEQSHQKFKTKFSLGFDLIADTTKEICTAYGVWGEKKNYGKVYFGIFRTTFIIDENGIILHVIEKVNTKDHTNQILELL